jgi:hypothetical protein
MKIYYKYIIIAALAISAVACSSGKKLSDSNSIITPLAGKLNIADGALIYALPLSVFDIIIETDRIIEKPGPYSRYAEDLLGLKDVIKNEREYWNINRIIIKTHIELDPSEFYVIESNSIFMTNVLSLKKEGLILDLNPEYYNSDGDSFLGAISVQNRSRVLDLGADEYFQERKDTLYKVVNVDTAFIKIPYLVEKKQKLTYDQLAEKAARRLMEMRDGKHSILTGETNVFPQNEVAINEMNRLEKDYTDLFAGKILKESHSFTYQIVPDREMSGKQITLCRFSESTGPAASVEKSGNPLTLEFVPEMKTKPLTVILHNQSNAQKSRNDKLYYRVPDVVKVKIVYGNEILSNSRQLVYQFGEVIQLPSNYLIGK